MYGMESSSDASWTEDDEYVESPKIRFDLPATDSELVQQVYDFIDTNDNVIISDILLKLARKYRFAGYIGSIDYLSTCIRDLQDEILELRADVREAQQRTWWSWIVKNASYWYSR
jgi:hypothetical protein